MWKFKLLLVFTMSMYPKTFSRCTCAAIYPDAVGCAEQSAALYPALSVSDGWMWKFGHSMFATRFHSLS